MNRQCRHEYRSFLTVKILWDKNLNNIIGERCLWIFFSLKSHQTKEKQRDCSVQQCGEMMYSGPLSLNTIHTLKGCRQTGMCCIPPEMGRWIQLQGWEAEGIIGYKWLSGEIQLIYTRSERSARQSFHRLSHTKYPQYISKDMHRGTYIFIIKKQVKQ